MANECSLPMPCEFCHFRFGISSAVNFDPQSTSIIQGCFYAVVKWWSSRLSSSASSLSQWGVSLLPPLSKDGPTREEIGEIGSKCLQTRRLARKNITARQISFVGCSPVRCDSRTTTHHRACFHASKCLSQARFFARD